MKYLFLILMLIGVVYPQNGNLVVIQSIEVDSAETNFTISLERGFFLAGLLVPASVTDTIQFEAVSGSTDYEIHNTDGTMYTVVCDSSQTTAIPLSPSVMYPWKTVKVLLNDATTSDVIIKAIKREY